MLCLPGIWRRPDGGFPIPGRSVGDFHLPGVYRPVRDEDKEVGRAPGVPPVLSLQHTLPVNAVTQIFPETS
jgi:hypothetical protein